MEAVGKDERRAFPKTKKRKKTNSVVAQPQTANTVDSQPVKDPSPFRFTWKIDRFSHMKVKKHCSDVFEVGGFICRLFIFPKANNVDYLSIYLHVADSTGLPYGWSYAQFSLTVDNQIMNKYSARKDMQHQFNNLANVWGFSCFISLSQLFDRSRGFLVNDTLVVEVEVTCNPEDNGNGIAEHLRKRLKKEQEVKAEAHLNTIIKVVTDEDLAKQIGKGLHFDLVDFDRVKSFRVQKHTSFNVFKEEVAKEFGIPARFQRFWLWGKRQNLTFRPSRPLTHIEEAGTVRKLKGKNEAELKLFLEVQRGQDLLPIAPFNMRKDDILLFLKLYDPEKEELRYVGMVIVNLTGKPSEILTSLNKLAGYDPDEEIELYEEIKFEPNVMCLSVDKKLTFQESELENGDIICFQKAHVMDNEKHIRYPDVPSYLEYLHNLLVFYSPFATESEDEESLEEQNENIIAEETNVDKIIEAQQSKATESEDKESLEEQNENIIAEETNVEKIIEAQHSKATESEDEGSLEEQNENIIAEETNVDKIIEAQHSKATESEDEESLEEQNDIISEETNVDKIIEAHQSKEVIETTHDEGTSKFNTSKLVSLDMEEIDAMIDMDVIAAIDRVLSEGMTLSFNSQHSVQGQEVSKLDPNLPEQLLQEFRDIAFKEDLVEKFKEGLIPKANFNAVKEKIDANADLFSSHQLEQVGVVVSLLNNIVRVFEKLQNLKKVRDSAKKSTGQDNEALKETRQKILTSKTSFTNHQTQLDSLDAQIADLKAKLEKLQGERAKIAEVQDQEKDKITSLNKEVKSIFHRIANDQIKLKNVEYKIPEAQTELESHEKVYKIFKATPPF